VRTLLPLLLARGPATIRDLDGHVARERNALLANARALACEGWAHVDDNRYRRGERELSDPLISLGDEAGWTIVASVTREGLHCALADPHGSPRFVTHPRRALFLPGGPCASPHDVHEQMIAAIASVRRRFAREHRRRALRLVGCVVTWPSRVDLEGEAAPFAPRPGWEDVSIRSLVCDAVREALGGAGNNSQGASIPVTILNDANAEALAEARIGKARDAQSLLMIKLGAGVGGALVVDGRLHQGAHGFAGELGHVPVDLKAAEAALRDEEGPDDSVTKFNPSEECSCGGKGHVQCYTSAQAVMERIRGRRVVVRDDDGMRAFIAATQNLTCTRTVVGSILWQTGWLVGYLLRAPVAALDPELVLIRVALGPRTARDRLLNGVAASLSEALPTQDHRLELGTWADSGTTILSLSGAGLHASDCYVVPRVRARVGDKPVAPAWQARLAGGIHEKPSKFSDAQGHPRR
jgi:predicted NBD/HSP70 family sugar kinase